MELQQTKRKGGGRRLAGVLALCLAVAGAALAPVSAQAFGPYGRWNYGWHGGRWGWWWVDAGVWTWYATYPYWYYPPYYYPYGYPEGYYAPPPPAEAPRQTIWYWCDAAKAYYPQVQSCPSGWREVPDTRPAPAPAPAPRSAPAPQPSVPPG